VLATGITTTYYTTTEMLTGNRFYSFKVESRNVFGYSTSFSNVALIFIAAPPTSPLDLANNESVTSGGKIGLTWSAPNSDGGSPVIDYEISFNIAGGASYSVLSTNNTTTSYTVTGLDSDVVYSLRVKARNIAGLSSDSLAVVIRAAAGPTGLAKPYTLLNSNLSVKITWVAPSSDGESPITGY
jgi:hypothetical protein